MQKLQEIDLFIIIPNDRFRKENISAVEKKEAQQEECHDPAQMCCCWPSPHLSEVCLCTSGVFELKWRQVGPPDWSSLWTGRGR